MSRANAEVDGKVLPRLAIPATPRAETRYMTVAATPSTAEPAMAGTHQSIDLKIAQAATANPMMDSHTNTWTTAQRVPAKA
jgi:hypothetical protein